MEHPQVEMWERVISKFKEEEIKKAKEIFNEIPDGATGLIVDLVEKMYGEYKGTEIFQCERCKKWFLKNEGEFNEDGDNWYCFDCWAYMEARADWYRDYLEEEKENN